MCNNEGSQSAWTLCHPLQLCVGECGMFLGHRAEAFDGLHEVFLVHILKNKAIHLLG